MIKRTDYIHRVKGRERAQSLVEFAISLVLILTILTGAVEISLALFEYVTIRDAAQEGALYGSINPTDVEGMQFRAKAAAADVLALDEVADITVSWSNSTKKCEGLTSGVPHSVTVKVTHLHQMVMPFIGAIMNRQQIPMSATVTDTILSPACP